MYVINLYIGYLSALQAYGNLLSLGEVELKQIGYIAVGLSASDFDQLWLNDTDIVYSFGSKTNYTSSQVRHVMEFLFLISDY